MIDKTMTRRQFNKILMAGMFIYTKGLLNNNLAASGFTNSSYMRGLGSYSATSLIKAIKRRVQQSY